MKQFKCKECSFEFDNRDKNNIEAPKRCPYCGKGGCVDKKKHIIDELDD
jgi:predicted Zn-ribbon and HTH transcriptional regulator